ncbi:hypothetical protein ABIE71_000302 [Bradyrhizobium diazoefficiens]
MPHPISQKSSAPSAKQAGRPGARVAEKVGPNRSGISRPQPQIGNRAMGRLLAAVRVQPKLAVAAGRDPLEREAERLSDAELAKPVPVDGMSDALPRMPAERAPIVQAKLTINQPGDRYEQEADAVAHAVMRMPEPDVPPTPAASAERTTPEVQRVRADREDEQGEQTGKPLQRKDQAAGPPRVTASVAADIGAMRGGGSALPATARAFFEPRFGADFSQVRIHTDARAAGTAKSLNARAFTVGWDIVFTAGQYSPASPEGQHLLAHELTHVVQQQGADRGPSPMAVSRLAPAHQRLQRWEGLEHKKIGNRAQNEFPYRGTIKTDMTALRYKPHKDEGAPHENTKADLLVGAKVLVLGNERGWLQIVVESGMARDKQGKTVSADTLVGYVSHELITKSSAVFDAEVPVEGGLVLSYGDLVAFGGDHFKDFAELSSEASSAAGRARLKKLRDLTDSEATQSPAYEEAATISKEYAERYKDLALQNVSHFSGGGSALTTWQTIHREAVLAALEAGKKGESGGLAKAYAMNAFGDHFLTDSFAAGHVRTPRQQAIDYYKKLAKDVFQHIIDDVSARLGNRIYELLRQDYRRVRWFGDEGDRRDAIGRVTTRITKGIADAGGPAKVQEKFGLFVGGAFSKIMHDRDNDQGLNVVSKKHPDGWTAFGDGKLETKGNTKNLAYVTEAVQASKQDLLSAFRIGADVLNKHGKTPSRAAIDAAMAELTKKVGPPYVALDFAPSPAPGVKPLPAWEWGKLDQPMKAEFVKVIGRYVSTPAQTELLAYFPVQEEIEIRGPNVDARPRDAAKDILNEFLADPVRFLEQAFGRAAGP